MSQRFFLSQTPTDNTAAIEGDEARHLSRVMRVKTGDLVELFDGQGTSWSATVMCIERNKVTLHLDAKYTDKTSQQPVVTLAVALPKGERQKWLIEKITELGTDYLIPLSTARSVAQPTSAAINRLRRGVVEACKQSKRNRLLEITPSQSLDTLLSTASIKTRILACPTSSDSIQSILSTPVEEILIVIGPEGGFTEEEIDFSRAHGFRHMSLGQNTLRIETAAIAAAVLAGQCQRSLS